MHKSIRTLITLLTGFILAIIIALGGTMPANAAIGYPQPKSPGCSFTWFGTVADCSIQDTYGGLVALSTPYLSSKDPNVRSRAIPAMVWTTLGGAVYDTNKGALKSASATNRAYIITAIANTNSYNPSNGTISCVRNVLLDYIVKAGKIDKLTSNAFQFWKNTQTIYDTMTDFKVIKDEYEVGNYLKAINDSKDTVMFVGKTVHVREAVEAIVSYCAG